MAYRYWDYYQSTGTNSTATPYYNTWGNGTATTSTTNTYCSTNTASYYVRQEYLITGFDDWSEQARATLTRLINDETQTGFRIKMWINGDIDITDMNVQVRDLDWFLIKLRQVASGDDYAKIAECVRAAREEAGKSPEQPA